MKNRKQSEILFSKAKQLMPAGVNSPVRAFRSVGGAPIFMKKGKGSHVIDEDDNEYIDYCCSWGPLILGHANDNIVDAVTEVVSNGTTFGTPTRQENDLAELVIDNHKYIEQIRFVSSGTEAAMSAIRLARGITGREKIIKFEGCYHGHVDSLLVNAGSGLATFGTASSAGIPDSFVKETIVLPLNDANAVKLALEKYKNEIACIAIEPIPANNGLLIQGKSFLQFLRDICDEYGVLLFFDEVISGFRVGFGGASMHYDIRPDLIAFGKVIGGGLPVGAFASTSKNMANLSPDGSVYQAGTLSGNPVAMAAGYAQLKQCLKPGFYEELNKKTEYLVTSVLNYAKEKKYNFYMYHVGSIYWLNFLSNNVTRVASEIKKDSSSYFKTFFHHAINNGVYLAPSKYEVGFVSAAHTYEDLDITIKVFRECLDAAYA